MDNLVRQTPPNIFALARQRPRRGYHMAMIDPNAGSEPCVSDVFLVLVTYHPDAGFPARLDRIRPQVGGGVIVDNGSDSASLQMLAKLPPGVLSVVFNQSNLGVARAFNIRRSNVP